MCQAASASCCQGCSCGGEHLAAAVVRHCSTEGMAYGLREGRGVPPMRGGEVSVQPKGRRGGARAVPSAQPHDCRGRPGVVQKCTAGHQRNQLSAKHQPHWQYCKSTHVRHVGDDHAGLKVSQSEIAVVALSRCKAVRAKQIADGLARRARASGGGGCTCTEVLYTPGNT